MSYVKPRLLKGMRDFLPADMRRRQYVISKIKSLFRRYGFEACETPTMEYADILDGKYGEEERLIYRFEDKGRRQVALKYDLTVPLARLVGMYQQELTMPFKRYQIQPVFRSEKPQKGRYREFYQCDVDIVGVNSILADAELILLAIDALERLGFKDFKVRINHRRLLSAIAEYSGVPKSQADAIAISIDKLDKIGIDGVRKDLTARGIEEKSRDKIIDLITLTERSETASPEDMLNQLRPILKDFSSAQDALDDLEYLFSTLKGLSIPSERYDFDLTLARGLGYYTGPIFEIYVAKPKIGSIGGGGRYGNLIGMFMRRNVPATGISLGLERIIDVMSELDMFPDNLDQIHVLVGLFNVETAVYSLQIAKQLREAGIFTDIYYQPVKLKKQFAYANKKNIPYVVMAGPDEQKENKLALKDMKTGEQRRMDLQQAIIFLGERYENQIG
ncbi:MAG: histidine--tRNA ligase [Candidatus Cloacimonetes bacterium 4572_55]|nr:MAG: histidine--tRNA ligase [Candidatus Cloacimonetes bacterium 4572_55]